MSVARWTPVIVAVALVVGTSCTQVKPATKPPTPSQLAELWHAPARPRDLYWGIGGQQLAPDPDVMYHVIEVKHGGFSTGLTVTDPNHRTWNAKFPPEAPTETVASRILWAV